MAYLILHALCKNLNLNDYIFCGMYSYESQLLRMTIASICQYSPGVVPLEALPTPSEAQAAWLPGQIGTVQSNLRPYFSVEGKDSIYSPRRRPTPRVVRSLPPFFHAHGRYYSICPLRKAARRGWGQSSSEISSESQTVD